MSLAIPGIKDVSNGGAAHLETENADIASTSFHISSNFPQDTPKIIY